MRKRLITINHSPLFYARCSYRVEWEKDIILGCNYTIGHCKSKDEGRAMLEEKERR